MTTIGSRAAALVVSITALAGLTWVSQTPMRGMRGNHGVLRLAWSARPERVEHCQQQSETELAKLPQHMRQAVVCTGETASYQLSVALNGVTAVDQVVRGGGLRHDRQLYVFRDVAVAPGEAEVEVRFTRIDATAVEDAPRAVSASAEPEATGGEGPGLDRTRRAREADERLREREAAVPAVLRLRQHMTIGSGQVVLVKYDADTRALTTVTRAAP